MSKFLDKLFPKDQQPKGATRMVQRGLEAIRMVRDSQSVVMGNVRRTPSHFELRVSTAQFEKLMAMDAVRDMEYHFKDELMRELAKEKGRTFGDHSIHVRVLADPVLNDNELYAMVVSPERKGPAQPAASKQKSGQTSPSRPAAANSGAPKPAPVPARPTSPPVDDDSTRMLGGVEEPEPVEADQDRTMVFSEEPTIQMTAAEPEPEPLRWTLRLSYPDGTSSETVIVSPLVVIGRTGTSGDLPEGATKLDFPFPPTVSRNQMLIELDERSVLIKRLGKGEMIFPDGSDLDEGSSRRIGFGTPIMIDGVELRIEAANSPKINPDRNQQHW